MDDDDVSSTISSDSSSSTSTSTSSSSSGSTSSTTSSWEWLEDLVRAELAIDPKEYSLLYDTDKSSREPTHWNGWGYADTKFELGPDGIMRLSGTRYDGLFQGGKREFPEFADWAESTLGLDLDEQACKTEPPKEEDYPTRCVDESFLEALAQQQDIEVLRDVISRLRHSHGHTCQEVYALRHLKRVPWRLPDLVVLISSEAAVEKVIQAAVRSGKVCLVPFGGGTNVTQALSCSEVDLNDTCVVSLDLRRMKAIKWINRNNMSACIQAGAIGRDIELKLNKFGLTVGHEPDSSEFSSLGGWVATKSSGMKKNTYGNIEDIVLDVSLITPGVGTLSRGSPLERTSIGPDPLSLAIGSEGTYGVVTQAVVRLRLKPQHQQYESFVFANFRHGVQAMREIALRRVAPSSVRLMDNTQFKMGQALKPPAPKEGTAGRFKHDLVDQAKKFYVTQFHGYDPDTLCAMVLLFEGNDRSQIRNSMAMVSSICRKYGGIAGGPDSGLRGYFLTYMIAYLRDFGLDYGFLSESFETTVRWTDVNIVYERVKQRIRKQAAEENVLAEPLIGGRVTQTYDTCACMYFYVGIINDGLEDPLGSFSRIEHAAREEILKLGGSLSHHHGVGRIRKGFYESVTNESERELLRKVKGVLDPTNVFSVGNLGYQGNNNKL